MIDQLNGSTNYMEVRPVQAIGTDTYDAEVVGDPGIVVVDWWGPKCAPCLALMPLMEELAQRWAGRAKFVKVNAQENRRLCIQEQVMGLPTLIVYKGGEKVDRLVGDAVTIAAIESRLASIHAASL